MATKEVIIDLDLSMVPTIPFWRPDSIEILRDRDAIVRFNRYWRILVGKAIAKFLLCKKMEVEKYDPTDEDQMRMIHDGALEELKEMLNTKKEEEITRWYRNQRRPQYNLLKLKRDLAWKILENCRFCERRCGVNRKIGREGFCKLGKDARISSMFIHVGEEPELVPSYTIFFSRCNFACVYCQNWDISQRTTGVVTVSRRGSNFYRKTLGKKRNKKRKLGWRRPNTQYTLYIRCPNELGGVGPSNMELELL